MKIIFNLFGCGLGNSGGASTIVKSANTLHDMGHEAVILDSGRNKHTWTKLKCKHKVVGDIKNAPKGDVIIATGFKTVAPTLKIAGKFDKVFHWIRAWEYWMMSDNDIIEKVLKKDTIKLVNSICLHEKLLNLGFYSQILRPGNDVECYYPTGKRRYKTIVLGGLFSTGRDFNRKRTHWCFKATSKLTDKGYNVKLRMYGRDEARGFNIFNYLRSPSISEKNGLYNEASIWLAPTGSEGLHIPPQEAMLTGCLVIGTKAELSGMQDFLVNGHSGFVSENNFESFYREVERIVYTLSLSDPEPVPAIKIVQNNAMSEIMGLGTRKENMSRLIRMIEEG